MFGLFSRRLPQQSSVQRAARQAGQAHLHALVDDLGAREDGIDVLLVQLLVALLDLRGGLHLAVVPLLLPLEEVLRAEADRVRFEVEAAGQQAVNEAANILSMEQISLQTKLALLQVLPEVIKESAKPMEAIDSIKIVQVDGLTQNGSGGGSAANDSGGAGGGSGNLASDAVSAALAYRAQAPVLDGLMKELGLDGSSLGTLVQAAAQEPKAEDAAAKTFLTDSVPEFGEDDQPTDEAAE